MNALALDVACSTILSIGSARAVLISNAPAIASERIAAANAALAQVANRADIVIARRPSGRPRLEPPLPELGVSLSVRDSHLLAGFSPTHTVGADLEVARSVPHSDVARLAGDHYAPAEARAVAVLRDLDEAHDLFLRLWVAKEAVLKATGRGVFDGLDQLDFEPVLSNIAHDANVVRVTETRTDSSFHVAVRRLRAADVPARDDCYAALAVCEARA